MEHGRLQRPRSRPGFRLVNLGAAARERAPQVPGPCHTRRHDNDEVGHDAPIQEVMFDDPLGILDSCTEIDQAGRAAEESSTTPPRESTTIDDSWWWVLLGVPVLAGVWWRFR